MVEEIITALSRIRWLFVIARNSSFSYKGQPPDVKRVGRELGVRYVLEGSVRKASHLGMSRRGVGWLPGTYRRGQHRQALRPAVEDPVGEAGKQLDKAARADRRHDKEQQHRSDPGMPAGITRRPRPRRAAGSGGRVLAAAAARASSKQASPTGEMPQR
jgi:hypothetical protein